jgi:hypothetical protein
MIEFKDKCKITRATGKVDKHDELIVEVIYEGACLYEEGGASASRLITLNPLLFLPTNKVLVETNDIVDIVTSFGRKRNSLVRIARDIRTRELSITRLELKQTTA